MNRIRMFYMVFLYYAKISSDVGKPTRANIATVKTWGQNVLKEVPVQKNWGSGVVGMPSRCNEATGHLHSRHGRSLIDKT